MFDEISEPLLHQALDGLAARQRVTANNLANADTPGYHAQEIRFEETFQAALRAIPAQEIRLVQTDARHLSLKQPDVPPFAVYTLPGQMRNDRNGVDLEQEVTRMAQAHLSYTALSQQMAGNFEELKYVIIEGGRG